MHLIFLCEFAKKFGSVASTVFYGGGQAEMICAAWQDATATVLPYQHVHARCLVNDFRVFQTGAARENIYDYAFFHFGLHYYADPARPPLFAAKSSCAHSIQTSHSIICLYQQGIE